jgi:hypothetical protein
VYSQSSLNFRQRLAIEPSPTRMAITAGPSNAGRTTNVQEERHQVVAERVATLLAPSEMPSGSQPAVFPRWCCGVAMYSNDDHMRHLV